MGHYISVRGWIECENCHFLRIENIIKKYEKMSDKYLMKNNKAELYQKGWHIPSFTVNWTSYVFFGADIRQYYMDFIKDQIIEIGKIDNEITGYFFIDDDEDEDNFNWKLVEGDVITIKRGSNSIM